MIKDRVTVAVVDPGDWKTGFGLAYQALTLWDVGHEGRLMHAGGFIRKHCPSGGLVSARNAVASAFLDGTDSEWLFWLDSDMTFAPDALDALIASAKANGAKVLGGLCFGLLPDPDDPEDFRVVPTLYQWLETEQDGAGFAPIMDYREGIQRVSATGSACILIHRRVLADLREYLGGDHFYDPVTHPTGGVGGGGRTFSEDLSFCVKVAQLGIGVHVDTSIKTGHVKNPFVLNEKFYAKDRMIREGMSVDA